MEGSVVIDSVVLKLCGTILDIGASVVSPRKAPLGRMTVHQQCSYLHPVSTWWSCHIVKGIIAIVVVAWTGQAAYQSSTASGGLFKWWWGCWAGLIAIFWGHRWLPTVPFCVPGNSFRCLWVASNQKQQDMLFPKLGQSWVWCWYASH